MAVGKGRRLWLAACCKKWIYEKGCGQDDGESYSKMKLREEEGEEEEGRVCREDGRL